LAIEIVRNTPGWVWALLAALLALGASQLRARRVPRWRLFLLPAVLLALGLSATAASFRPAGPALAAWALALAAGAWFGRRQPPPAGARWDAEGRVLRLPGSAWPLVVILAVFTLRYAAGVALALQPAWRTSPSVALPLAAVYGAIGGTLLGRALALRPPAAPTIAPDGHPRHA
jgi:hypothetical protein